MKKCEQCTKSLSTMKVKLGIVVFSCCQKCGDEMLKYKDAKEI